MVCFGHVTKNITREVDKRQLVFHWPMGARRRSATQRTAKGVREGQGGVVSEEEGGRGREKGKGVRSWAFSAGGRSRRAEREIKGDKFRRSNVGSAKVL